MHKELAEPNRCLNWEHGNRGSAKRRNPFRASEIMSVELEKLGVRQSVPAGTILFREGEDVRGVYLVLNGRFALSAGEDPTRVTRIAEHGSLLGLPATVRSKPYSLTAEAVTDADVCLVSVDCFRTLIVENSSIGMEVIAMLADEVATLRKISVYRL